MSLRPFHSSPWLIVLCAAALCGEQPAVHVFTTEDGLIGNWITCIRRDSKGYLWFGTREGLSLFDGRQFTNYTTADGLPHASVFDFLETRRGEYWIATAGGLYQFRFRRPAPGESTRPRFEPIHLDRSGAAQSVYALLEDHSGAIWCGTSTGLYQFRPDEPKRAPEFVPLVSAAQPEITDLAEDAKGRLWIATAIGLFRRLPSGEMKSIPRLTPIQGAIHTILMEEPDRLWLGGTGGLARLRTDTDPPQLAAEYRTAGGKPLQTVDAIHRSPDGTLWLASFGLIRFCPDAAADEERFRRYPSSQILGPHSISAIAEDQEGNLWLGVSTLGAARIARDHISSYLEADGLESRTVQGLFQSRSGEFIAVSARPVVSGLHQAFNRFDGVGFQPVIPRLPNSHFYLGWGHGPIALQDRAGDWWRATGEGVLRYTGVDDIRGLARRMPQVYSKRDGLPQINVLRLFEDSRGNIWAGTFDGVARWNRRTSQWKSYPGPELVGRSFGPASIHAIAEDRSGAVWLGIYRWGLGRFRGDTFEPVPAGIPPGSIDYLFTDSRGRLWIATTQGGAGVMDHPEAARPEVRVYNREQGLSSNSTHSITEDRWGRIYIATAGGVDRLDPATGRIHHFTTASGLPPGEIERLFCDRQGAIWFASNFGLARLLPESDRISTAPAPLLRSIRVDGVTFLASELGQREFPAFELKPDQGNLEIDYSAIHFRAGERLRYQYRLDGADRDWNAPVDNLSAHYARLAPGNYRFEVRAVNDDQMISPHTASVSFRLLAPLWQRAWFQAVGLFAAGLLAVALHRMRTEQLLKLERVRTRIATDLHDDIGASLSQMAILSEVIGRRAAAGDATQVQSHAHKVAGIARELVDSMSDIVWAINPAKDKLADLEQRMREFAGEMLLPLNIALDFESAAAGSTVSLGIDERREVLLIFKEAIHNVVQHSSCTEARVRLASREGRLLLEVRDNGKGFDRRAAAGNGLGNIRRRAGTLRARLDFHSAEGEGTTLALSVPLRAR